ncbi:MAG: pyridoxamine 5'-phosphate oxidase [Deltaproteobacteria bacterium]|nr:pyridoxamine 5'-phosphate oxidase [Deltaproteobacteria bacterium]
MPLDFNALRKEYRLASLDEAQVDKSPIAQFKIWFDQAISSQLTEPNAMTLATASSNGVPSARVVLLKEYGETGFTFFTNYRSRKGVELKDNPRAALLFYWAELERQIRIEGSVDQVSRPESESYFKKRPRKSQIGANASLQSSPLKDRATLEQEAARLEQLWEGQEVPCPASWGGYLLRPEFFEFWQGRESRLHDRICYRRDVTRHWLIERLAP